MKGVSALMINNLVPSRLFMKKDNILFGLLCIVGAIAVICNGLGLFGNLNIGSIIVTVLMIPIILSSLLKLNFYGIFFPIAVLWVIYSKNFGIFFEPWKVMLVALLLSIGFSMIFPGKSNQENNK